MVRIYIFFACIHATTSGRPEIHFDVKQADQQELLAVARTLERIEIMVSSRISRKKAMCVTPCNRLKRGCDFVAPSECKLHCWMHSIYTRTSLLFFPTSNVCLSCFVPENRPTTMRKSHLRPEGLKSKLHRGSVYEQEHDLMARADRCLGPEGQGPPAEPNHQGRPQVHRHLRPLANEDPDG